MPNHPHQAHRNKASHLMFRLAILFPRSYRPEGTSKKRCGGCVAAVSSGCFSHLRGMGSKFAIKKCSGWQNPIRPLRRFTPALEPLVLKMKTQSLHSYMTIGQRSWSGRAGRDMPLIACYCLGNISSNDAARIQCFTKPAERTMLEAQPMPSEAFWNVQVICRTTCR